MFVSCWKCYWIVSITTRKQLGICVNDKKITNFIIVNKSRVPILTSETEKMRFPRRDFKRHSFRTAQVGVNR